MRLVPIPSNSSIKIIHGAIRRAFLNNIFTFMGPIAINILSKSVALAGMNETFDSPARAFANRVFPFPGVPSKRIPFGILTPAFCHFFGFRIMSITCSISCLRESIPTTSEKFFPVERTHLKVFGEINFLKTKITVPKNII